MADISLKFDLDQIDHQGTIKPVQPIGPIQILKPCLVQLFLKNDKSFYQAIIGCATGNSWLILAWATC